MAGKRSHGEGYVRQLPSGNWRGQLMDGYTDDGKKNTISFSAPTKKEVLAMMREYQMQKEAHVHINKKLQFSDWAEKWYEGYSDQVQPSTYCNYRYTLDIIIRHLGDKVMAEVLPMDIERFIRTIGKTYSVSQVTKCRSMLIQIYDYADANGLVMRNPARKAKKPRNLQQEMSTNTKNKKDAFTDEEVDTMQKHHDDSMIGNTICLMLGTGMRVQEVLALTKEDIAADGSTITINKAVKTVNGKSTIGPPKSKRSNRVIPVPEEYREYALYLREHGRTPFLWTSSWKNPVYSVKTFRNQYYKALEALPDVRRLSPHCCRHTYITRLQANNVPIEMIARLAGHSSIDTTDGYTHTSVDTLAKAVSVLNADHTKDGGAA